MSPEGSERKAAAADPGPYPAQASVLGARGRHPEAGTWDQVGSEQASTSPTGTQFLALQARLEGERRGV